MAVHTDRSVFYHVAKSGGIWVKEAMRHSGLPYGRCRDRHVDHPFGLKREHSTPDVVMDEDKEGRFSFCFVRHPVTWYQSFWCYRIKTDALDMKFPLDRLCWHDEFESFVRNVLDMYPQGFVTRLYQYYVGSGADGVDFIGRQESLADDLVKALTLAGEDFDEDLLRTTRMRNVASSHRKFRDRCKMPPDLWREVEQVEEWVMNTFYSSRINQSSP